MKANILVCGRTGVGKTSLIQAICGKSIVPEERIGHAEPTTRGYDRYAFDRFVFWDSPGFEPGEDMNGYIGRIHSFLCRKLEDKEPSEHIHVLWYCISGEGARVVDFDKIFARKFPIPTIAVVTKDDITSRAQRKKMSNELDGAAFARQAFILTSSAKRTGIDRLLKITGECLPQGIDFGKQMIQRIQELEQLKKERANATINWAAGRAAAIAVIPLPIVDFAPLAANEIYMIMKIGAAYGIPVSKTMITTFLGVLGASFAGKGIASFLPGLKIPIAAAVTYGVGKAAQVWFENERKLSQAELKRAYQIGLGEYRKAN